MVCAANGLCLVVADIVVVEAVFASRAQGGEADSGGMLQGPPNAVRFAVV